MKFLLIHLCFVAGLNIQQAHAWTLSVKQMNVSLPAKKFECSGEVCNISTKLIVNQQPTDVQVYTKLSESDIYVAFANDGRPYYINKGMKTIFSFTRKISGKSATLIDLYEHDSQEKSFIINPVQRNIPPLVSIILSVDP